jgi:hypothetical protein
MEGYERRLLDAAFEKLSIGLTPSQRRMLSVAGYMGGAPPGSPAGARAEVWGDGEADREGDEMFASLRRQIEEMTSDHLRRSARPAVREAEIRVDAEREAADRARDLMRPLSEEERAAVEDAIFGPSPDEDEVMASEGADRVIRSSMRKLAPRQWLNDEVIHFFYVMLSKRDDEMCRGDPGRRRSHFFKSFFVTKLLQEGHATQDGQYDYKSVRRWSRFVPGTCSGPICFGREQTLPLGLFYS